MGDSEQHRHWEWSRLPAELRHRILHLLPLPSALVARAVCRDWKDSLSTWSGRKSWFLVKDEQVEQEGSFKWSMVDAETGDWIRLDGLSRFATSVASGDGLVCLCVGNSARPEFYVGNPLFEKSWRKLPELPPLKTLTLARLVLSASALTCVLGIVCGEPPGVTVSGSITSSGVDRSPGFKVLVGRCGYIVVYDSSAGKWREVQGETPQLALQLLQETDERSIVPVRRGAQLLWSPLRSGGGIVGFDFAALTWFVLEATLFERLSAASLTRDPSSGSILLVGAHRSSGSHHFRHLKVWRLDEDEELGHEWKSVNRMKDYMVQEISPKGFFAAHWCRREAKLMLLTCTLEKFSSQLRDWGFKRLVLWSYDPLAAKWSSNPLRRPLRDVDLSTTVVYSFQPRLDFQPLIDG